MRLGLAGTCYVWEVGESPRVPVKGEWVWVIPRLQWKGPDAGMTPGSEVSARGTVRPGTRCPQSKP